MENPGTSLIRSVVASAHTTDLLDKLGEVALDQFLEAGILKDLPVIGIGISLYRAGNGAIAYLFVKKLIKFLSETDQLDQAQRDKFYRDLSARDAENLGETTLMILDKCDSALQAELLGRAFRRLIEGIILRDTYELYAFAIRDLNSYHVKQIRQFYENPTVRVFDPVAATFLSIHGIIEVATTGFSDGHTMNKDYRATPFGQGFYDLLIKA